jgi:hypothetical protein
MPGGTPGKPEQPAQLNTRQTPRLHTLEIYDRDFRVFGSDATTGAPSPATR